MNQFIQMDAFFFVTTTVVIIVGVLLAVVLFRILKILGHVEEISKVFSEETDLFRKDIAELRTRVREEGFKVIYFKKFFDQVTKRLIGKKKHAHKSDTE